MFTALLADFIRNFIFNLNFLHLFFCKFKSFLEGFVKFRKNLNPILRAFFYMVKITFHVGSKLYIKNFWEKLFHLFYDKFT
ncbi:hypothetical protein D3C75_1162280 [compost metagenome]